MAEDMAVGVVELSDEERKALKKKADRAKARRNRKVEHVPHTITSLMDALTIILCFLLKSIGSEPLNVSQSDDLRLPKSTTQMNPESDSIPLTMTALAILVGDKHVVDVKDGEVDKSRKKGGEVGFLITPLFDALTEEAQHQKNIAKISGAEFDGTVAVIADKDVPYRLLTEVMYTAGQAEFSKFKFAVVKLKGD